MPEIHVGNQLLILLISFLSSDAPNHPSWESVTNPLDKLSLAGGAFSCLLGISYQSS